ncbi:hypothetical protein BH09PAT2_BH09PAT2_04800 [soil metagenome]
MSTNEKSSRTAFSVGQLASAIQDARDGSVIVGKKNEDGNFDIIVLRDDKFLPEGSFIIPLVALENALELAQIHNKVLGFEQFSDGMVVVTVEGRMLSEQDKVLFEQLKVDSRKIVARVNAGTLQLDRSKVIDDHLFVATNQDYLVFAPDGKMGLSAELFVDKVNWRAPLNMEGLRNALIAFESWLAE